MISIVTSHSVYNTINININICKDKIWRTRIKLATHTKLSVKCYLKIVEFLFRLSRSCFLLIFFLYETILCRYLYLLILFNIISIKSTIELHMHYTFFTPIYTYLKYWDKINLIQQVILKYVCIECSTCFKTREWFYCYKNCKYVDVDVNSILQFWRLTPKTQTIKNIS